MFKDDFEPTDNQALITKANKIFNWLISYMIFKYIYVHFVLMTMHRVPQKGLKTMAVHVESGEMYLHYGPQWFSYLTPGEATYIFTHECFHVMLHHCTGRKHEKDFKLWNVAQDLAVNELIDEIKPDSCIRPRDEKNNLCGCFVDEMKKNPFFSDIQSKQTAEWYFTYLRKKRQEYQDKKGKGELQLPSPFDSHEGHKEDEIANERVFSIVKDMSTSDAWGNISAASREAVMAAQIRRINWAQKIVSWFGTIAWHAKTETRKRPNRRMGYAFPGAKRLYVDRWLLAVDTSGSCFVKETLSRWKSIMDQLAESFPIDYVEFDTKVMGDPKPYTRKVSFNFKGGGGTSFDPVCKLCDDRHYIGVIFLTDGCAEAPHKPNRTKVLWCLPNKRHKPPVEWGDRVYIEA